MNIKNCEEFLYTIIDGEENKAEKYIREMFKQIEIDTETSLNTEITFLMRNQTNPQFNLNHFVDGMILAFIIAKVSETEEFVCNLNKALDYRRRLKKNEH